MGIGKTTAIRTLCGTATVDCDVANLDNTSHEKSTTTVGFDFGLIELGDGHRLQIMGSPGQDRFSFVRNWLLSVAVGTLILIDPHDDKALDQCLSLLTQIEADHHQLPTIVVVARPTDANTLSAFSMALTERAGRVIPTVVADVRDRAQILAVLELLLAIFSSEFDDE